jgi:arylsulfatase A-like enzyme
MPDEAGRANAAWRLLLQALIVVGYLFACRLVIVWQARPPGEPIGVGLVLDALGRFGMDALAVAALTLAALAVSRLSQRAAAALMVAGGAFLMLLGAINTHLVALYRQPATLDLLGYGDFFGIDGLRSFADYVTVTDALALGGALVCLAAFALAGPVLRSRAFARRGTRRLVLVLSFAALVAMPVYGLLHDDAEMRRRHANAGWWLVKSALAPAAQMPAIAHPDMRDPFATFAVSEQHRITTPERIRAADIRNVVVIVLESVGSGHLDLADDPELTPHLARLRAEAAYFPNTYVPMPSSPVSLFSLLTGMYPPVAPAAIPVAEPRFPAQTLFERLSAAGLRSASFSTTWGFMDLAGFLDGRGAERVEQRSGRGECRTATPEPAAQPADRCTFAALEQWVGRSDDRFFALLWTSATHYPYGLDPAAATRPAAARAGYRERLAETGRLVGEFVAWLQDRGALERTLVVLVGDHGEAFFEHGTMIHGNDVYGESVRVPLMFVNPTLFDGVTDPSPVRLIDVAPTVLSLAGAAPLPTAQGVDLAGPLRPRRVFYAAAWLNRVLGFREGAMKYNYHPATGALEAFDLARDPGERTDLGGELDAGARAAIVRRIANWNSAVDARIAEARSGAAR